MCPQLVCFSLKIRILGSVGQEFKSWIVARNYAVSSNCPSLSFPFLLTKQMQKNWQGIVHSLKGKFWWNALWKSSKRCKTNPDLPHFINASYKVLFCVIKWDLGHLNAQLWSDILKTNTKRNIFSIKRYEDNSETMMICGQGFFYVMTQFQVELL